MCLSSYRAKQIGIRKLKSEYDLMFDCITRGNILRSKATWYEKGEKNNKYFLGLEKSRKMKNCIRKLHVVNKHGQTVTNSKAIMIELRRFYEDLYDNKDSGIDNDDLQSFDQSLNIPKLSDNLKPGFHIVVPVVTIVSVASKFWKR